MHASSSSSSSSSSASGFSCLSLSVSLVFLPESQREPVEKPGSGQAESVLRGEPQRVRLGAHHHPPRALRKSAPPALLLHDDGEGDEMIKKQKAKDPSFQPFLPRWCGIRGRGRSPPCGSGSPLLLPGAALRGGGSRFRGGGVVDSVLR